MKTTLVLSLLALSVRVLAVPPACLLNAVNTQDEPSDLKAVCGKESQAVQEAIASMCGDNTKAAQSAFIATCSGAGVSVAPYTATSTPSPTSGTFVYTTAVYDPDCSCTTTIVTSATGGSSGATATGSAGSASETGNFAIAARDVKGMGSFAAVVVAVAGAIAAL